MDEASRVLAAIAALQAQRPLLGDAVVDTALAPLQAQLARLRAAAQQRRQVSVLFLDMVGSTALSGRLDPEDVAALMDGLLARCTEVVARHGGRTLQYAGDSLLAAFGSEGAAEDDAERAVHCGLALLDEGRRLGERVEREHGQAGCQVRVGIHTGPVLLGGGVDEEGSIRGLTVNIAARMEQTAPPGTLRVSHDTWLMVRGAFEAEPQPPLQVKGREAPLRTHLVRRARPPSERLQARGIDGLVAPLIGRDADLALLRHAADEALSGGTARGLTLVAEAGVGKSRLLGELRAGLLEAHPQAAVLAARTHPHTRLQPYGLLRDLLARRLQIADSDALAVARARVAEALGPALPATADERVEARVARLAQLMGIDCADSPHVQDCSPLQLRRSGLASLGQWLQAQAAGGPGLALLLEDLHWADEASLDALEELLPRLAALPLLVVATTRPELLEARPAWGEALPGHRRHRLEPLGDVAGGALASVLLERLAGDPNHAAMLALLRERSAGNPFFMEELLRMLRDDGVIADAGSPGTWTVVADRLTALRLPGTLVGVLQARLDRLPEAERAALQRASIVGPVFWDEALAALDPQAPQQLPPLRARALVQRREPSAFEGTAEDRFAHHLLHQVTYDTVLKPMRVTGHAAAAAWLAARVGQRASEYLATTADHYERAGNHAQAFDFLARACRAASDRYANATALAYADRALANPVAATRVRERIALLERRTWLLDMMGRRAEHQQAADAWEAAARASGDEGLLAAALFGQALLASRRSDEARSLVLALQAIEAGERGGNPLIAAQAMAQVAWVRHTEGAGDAALAMARRALDRALSVADDGTQTHRLRVVETQLTVMLGMIQRAAGLFAVARATLERGLALTRRLNNRRSECHVIEGLGTLARACGEPGRGLALSLECIELGQAVGAATSVAWGHYAAGRCLFELDRRTEAGTHFAQAAALAERLEERRLQALVLCRHGVASSAPDRARALFDGALALLERGDDAGLGGLVLGWRALAELEQGDLAAARRSLERLDAQGPAGASDDDEAPLVPPWARHRVLAALGRQAEADAALRQAHAQLQAWADRIDDPALRAGSLAGVRLYREIAAAWALRFPA